MSTKVKMLINNRNFNNQSLHLPVDGIVKLVDGAVEVSEPCAAILETIPEWERADAKIKAEKATKSKNKVQPQGEQPASDQDEQQARLVESLDKLTLEELKTVAESSNIKNWKVFKNNEKALRTYIRNQFIKQLEAQQTNAD